MGSWPTHGVCLVVCIWTVCHFASSCPPGCVCQVSNETATVTVPITCAQINLTSMPNSLPENTRQLDLSGNMLTSIKPKLSPIESLVNLNLSSNNIDYIDHNSFSSFNSLKILDLSANKLDLIEDRNFENLSSLEELHLSQNKLLFLENETFFGLTSLRKLYLNGNEINDIGNGTFLSLEHLELLDLSFNELTELEASMFTGLKSLVQLDMQHNAISTIEPDTFLSLANLEHLNLAGNKLAEIDAFVFYGMPHLTSLSLKNNNIHDISAYFMGYDSQLEALDLSDNQLRSISIALFDGLNDLNYLNISHMPLLQNLSYNAFHGLSSLTTLDLSQNRLTSFITPQIFEQLPNLVWIDLSNNNISMLSELTFHRNTRLKTAVLKGNIFRCTCSLAWLAEKITDKSPEFDQYLQCTFDEDQTQQPLSGSTLLKEMCNAVGEVNTTDLVTLAIGAQAILRCDFTPDQHSVVIWTTPRKQVLTYHAFHPDATAHLMTEDDLPLNGSYHEAHYWHKSSSYQSNLISDRNRVRLLDDGSLYIDYVLRGDNGPYTCLVRNAYDNSSSQVWLNFDYSVIFDIKIMSIIVGLSSAFSFLLLNLIFSAIGAIARRLVNKRRREAIHTLVTNIDTYKTQQFGRLRDNYSMQLNRIRDQYHNQFHRLSDNYHSQLKKVRKGCSLQVDRIRDNYTTQVGRLRNYSTHQVEQIRDMYNNQLLKIRDYGSLQMVRIHDKYKLKQQHIIKLLETMNLDNCRTVIETECMRTESMIFDMDILQEAELSPLPMLSGSDSEYVTASSSENSSCSSLNTSAEDETQEQCMDDVVLFMEDDIQLDISELQLHLDEHPLPDPVIETIV